MGNTVKVILCGMGFGFGWAALMYGFYVLAGRDIEYSVVNYLVLSAIASCVFGLCYLIYINTKKR